MVRQMVDLSAGVVTVTGSVVTVNKSLMVMGIPSIAKKSRNVASVSSVTARTDTLEGFIKRFVW